VFHVCPQCRLYRADQIVEPRAPGWAEIACPECGFRRSARYLPLYIVGGASGSGKSSLCNALAGNLEGFIPLDSDILWQPAYNRPEESYSAYFNQWLRLCSNIYQAGKPVVLFGAGAGVPSNIEGLVERRYFPAVRYLALVCADGELERRLTARPAWRGAADRDWIRSQVDFNNWFRQASAGEPPIDLLDTTTVTLGETVAEFTTWIRKSSASSFFGPATNPHPGPAR
jgi:energy-coupling factor transporter ATP-binding protein EcfA2